MGESTFREEVPPYRLREEDMSSFYMVDYLRNRFGGTHSTCGPWSKEHSEKFTHEMTLSDEIVSYYDEDLTAEDPQIIEKTLSLMESSHEDLASMYEERHIYSKENIGDFVIDNKDYIQHAKALVISEGHRFKCAICLKYFNDKSNSMKHVGIHMTVKKYSCTLCKYSASDRSNVMRHMNIHKLTQMVEYTCNICSKVVKSRDNIKMHVLTHTIQKSPKMTCLITSCDSFGKTFTCFKQHLLKKHLISNMTQYIREVHRLVKQKGVVCTCSDHWEWIYKYVFTDHNCYLCSCKYKFAYKLSGENPRQYTRVCSLNSKNQVRTDIYMV